MKVNNSHIKLITTWLRHKPYKAGLKLDSFGWVGIEDLLNSLQANGIEAFSNDLEKINNEMPIQMWQFDKVQNKIRATHGHSIPIKIDIPSKQPPDNLYHASTIDKIPSVLKYGLLPMWRQFINLTSEKDFAVEYSKKDGSPFIFGINAKAMFLDDFRFYNPQKTLWISRVVPIDYLFCNSWAITRDIENLNTIFNVIPAENSIYIYSNRLMKVITYNTIKSGNDIHTLDFLDKNLIPVKSIISEEKVLILLLQ